ncbi:MAG TPA: hypothetical protein VGU65_11310 [Frateuria sp.]|uniref:hypothetical protein n=1 Tax=Frateuria sp. TaxID=2211372 RepID=UPI002DE4BC51|nr:hypothetical protein [Frateuria sp.]
MKFETLMLHSLFAACLLLCVGVMSAMLVLPSPTSLAASNAKAAAVVADAAG